MAQSRRQIFRQQAIQHYIQSNSQDILPRTISPLTFTIWWILLHLIILAGLLVWFIPIPDYASAPGIVLDQPSSSHPARRTQLLIFFPEHALPLLHQGQPVQVQVGSNGPQLSGKLERIASQPLSTQEIERRYGLRISQLQELPPVAIVGTVRLDQQGLLQRSVGSSVSVQYQQGTRNVLTLLLHLSS